MSTSGRDDADLDITASAGTGQRLPDDAAVELEWQRLERERIAEERDEAREDAITSTASRRRFPWPGLLAALAAGLIAAIILNAWLASLRTQTARESEAASHPSGTGSTP